jgi:hypothetical protein
MDFVTTFKENSYVHVPNIVSKELTTFLYNYLILKSCTNKNFSETEGYTNSDKYMRYCYGDTNTECLSTFLLNPISEIVNKNLCPTYSYTRVYTKGEILMPHSDRPSCEYSITINFGGDPWAIYFGEYNKGMNINDGYSLKKEITMNPGDGVIYMGEKLVHWRNKFEGDHCAQAFLHYIDKDGPHYPEWKYDKRKNIAYRK